MTHCAERFNEINKGGGGGDLVLRNQEDKTLRGTKTKILGHDKADKLS